MDDKLQVLRQRVREASANPSFIHYTWFVKWHLELVEKIANELLEHYPEADQQLVEVMVWMHDYGKILDFDNQYQTTTSEGLKLLQDIGFDDELANRAIEYISILDKKLELDIRQQPIEVQIVSSADGCSHLVGPFMDLWWYENSSKPFEELMEDNLRKANKDWTRKIVLPEAQKAFEPYNQVLRVQSGEVPDRFIQQPE